MGVIERRVFLDLAKIPPCHDRVIERLAFIQGEFLSGSSPAALFRRLATIRVLPFLFATDGSRVLLGTLSPAPPTPTKADMKPAVLANLQRFLRSIDIVRERVASLSVVVNHRYDRLFAIQPVS
jgi:hypothetical protein